MSVLVVDIILIIIIILFIASDIPLALDKVRDNTWSSRFSSWNAGNFPMTGFCVMFVAGHWSIPNIFEIKYSFLISMIALLVNVIGIQIARYIIKVPFNKTGLSIIGFIGLLHGWLLWGV